MTHVFVTHAGEDLDWACWVADGLLARGYEVELAHRDWAAGDNAIERMNAALERAAMLVGIWSPSYFRRDRYSRDELNASTILQHESGTPYIPVVVADCDTLVPPLQRPAVRLQLTGLDEQACDAALDDRFGDVKTPWQRRSVRFPGSDARNRRLASAQPMSLIESLAVSQDLLTADRPAGGLALDEIDRLTRYWASAFNWQAPQPLMTEVTQTYRSVRDTIATSHGPRDRRRLYNLGSRLSGVQAYAAMDLGFIADADRLADTARFCAERSGDVELEAWAWGTRALIARLDGRHEQALMFMRRALALDVRGHARARLHSGAGLSHAALGDETGTRRHLELAEVAMAEAGVPGESLQGIFRFSHAKLHAYAAQALGDLRSAALAGDAIVHVEAALRHFQGDDFSEHSFSDELLAQIQRAAVLHRGGRLDTIVPALEPLHAVSPEYRTAWHRSQLLRLSNALDGDPAVPSEISETVAQTASDFQGEAE